MAKLLIRNVEVLNFEGSEPKFLPGQDLLIEGNQISAIQPTSAPAPKEAPAPAAK